MHCKNIRALPTRPSIELHWMSVGVTGATCIPSPWLDMTSTALDECGNDGRDLHPLSVAGHAWYCTG